MPEVRALLVTCIAALGVAMSPALAASPGRVVSTSGVRLALPAGWQAIVAKTPQCDPERLIVASSGRLRVSANGRVSSARPEQVIVLLLEDRLSVDRPVGDLRRPRHFTVDWGGLRTLSPDGYCGNPKGAAAMHYIRTSGRYLGFIVYPGSRVSAATRTQTLALMDSLRVSP